MDSVVKVVNFLNKFPSHSDYLATFFLAGECLVVVSKMPVELCLKFH
jgi:hypothetical protein